jgi:hypothetical protein
MEQIMECLLSKMVRNQKEVKAHHEKMEAMIKFGQQKMIAKIKARQERLEALLDANPKQMKASLGVTEACLEMRETHPEEIGDTAEQQEAPNEGAALETIDHWKTDLGTSNQS